MSFAIDPLRPTPTCATPKTLPHYALLQGPLPTDAHLSPQEKALLGPRAVPKRIDDFTRGRFVAKQVLAASRPGSLPQDFIVLPNPKGAPIAYDSALRELTGLAVSISHTDDLAMAAMCSSPCRIGADIERPIANPMLIIEEYFTPEETALCSGLTGQALALRSALIWTVKEALMKALEEGLRLSTLSVGLSQLRKSVGFWQNADVFIQQSEANLNATARAWVHEGPEWVACIAVLAPPGVTIPDQVPSLVEVRTS